MENENGSCCRWHAGMKKAPCRGLDGLGKQDGLTANQRYSRTEKGIAARQRAGMAYARTEKGKAARRRAALNRKSKLSRQSFIDAAPERARLRLEGVKIPLMLGDEGYTEHKDALDSLLRGM